MILGSLLGQIFSPIFHAMSWLLAFYYGLVPNYVVAITLLTFTVMIVSFPLNRAATRSMFKMQLLAPEMQKIRNKYKVPRDASAIERQELRQKMNEETMALYRENNVSMLGGCLPNLAVFPIFIILYDVVRGLTTTCLAVAGSPVGHCASAIQLKTPKGLVKNWAPRYAFYQNTALYRNLHAANGQMRSFGINLANTVRTTQAHWYLVLPFVAFVLIAIALQYLQLRQMTRRNTASATAPGANQMQTMQRVMPLIMAVIYISIPAAVVTYFVASSLFRIGQQEWMYRRDPQITAAVRELANRKSNPGDKKAPLAREAGRKTETTDRPAPRTFRERLALAIAPPEDNEPPASASGNAKANGRASAGKAGGSPASTRPGGQKSAGKPTGNKPQGKPGGNRSGSAGGSPQGGSKSPGSNKTPASNKTQASSSSTPKQSASTSQGDDRKESRNGSGNSSGTGKSETPSGSAPSSANQRRRPRRSG